MSSPLRGLGFPSVKRGQPPPSRGSQKLNLERSSRRAGAVRAPCYAEEWVARMTALARVSNPLGLIRFSNAALGTCGHPSALAPPSWVPASPPPAASALGPSRPPGAELSALSPLPVLTQARSPSSGPGQLGFNPSSAVSLSSLGHMTKFTASVSA